MRILTCIFVLGAVLLNGQVILEGVKSVAFGAEDPQEAKALALRCGGHAAHEKSVCEQELRQDFQSGMRDPTEVVRLHCIHFANRWSNEIAPPDELCRGFHGS